MSATVAVGSDFDFAIGQLGLDNPVTFDAGTPFDFKTQALTFIPQIAQPIGATTDQWRAGFNAGAIELIEASKGRALVLFTSRDEMDRAYATLGPKITKLGYKIFKQGEGSNDEIRAGFIADTSSVLFGMESFGTGMDVQGESLTLTIINKATFVNPKDVVFAARCRVLDKKYGKWSPRGSFNGLAIPSMILTLVQYYGRQIRTKNDRGVVAIFDSRLYGKGAKSYGSKVLAALPNAPVTSDFDVATDFLRGL